MQEFDASGVGIPGVSISRAHFVEEFNFSYFKEGFI